MKPEKPQDPEVIFADPVVGIVDEPNPPRLQVLKTPERIGDLARGIGVERVHGEIAARGVLGYDICAYNDQDRSLGRVTARLLNRLSTFEVRPIDVQTYYVARAIAVPGEQEEQGQKGGGEA